jgi:tetratricopeptide (TPR) repeat protein
MIRFVAALLPVILLSACSTLHRPVQPQARLDADTTLRAAQQQERLGNGDQALRTYANAYRLYQQFAGTEGQIYSLAGAARIQEDQGDSLAYNNTRKTLETLISDVSPRHAWVETVLDLYLLQQQGAYEEISSLALIRDGYPLTAKLQILAYAVQADAYLQKPDATRLKQLEALAKKAGRKLRAQDLTDADAVSHAHYALAYNHYLAGALSPARRSIDKSVELDYLYGNFASLGYSLWLKSLIAIRENSRDEALALLLRARDIFGSASNAEMLEKINSQLEALGKGKE